MSDTLQPALRGAWWGLVAIVTLFAGWRITLLALDPAHQPGYQLKLSDQAMREGNFEAAAIHAREALKDNPFDGRPYIRLAEFAMARGDTAEAEELIALAVKHSPREPLARALSAQLALNRQDWAEAMRHFDRMLRVGPNIAPQTFPVIDALAADPSARPAVVATLARYDDSPASNKGLKIHPAWRTPYLLHHAAQAPDPRPLFSDLRRASELTDKEQDAHVARYVRESRWGEAFAEWTASLPVTAITQLKTPVDGGFERPFRAGPPFGWDIQAPKGTRVGIQALPGGEGHGLHVEFLGRRAAFSGVKQLMMLPPGTYQLSWRHKLEKLETPRGLRWTLTCTAGAAPALVSGPLLKGSGEWTAIEEPFTVPADCPAQWLVLKLDARIPAETLAVGGAWFDDVRIRRAQTG
ncbi:MAG: tetratricopeptide repeat protein [Steroidobacteraceae bacterium]